MRIEVGNDKAKEAYRDPLSDDPDLVRYRESPGQKVTTLVFPEGMSLQEAFKSSIAALSHHFASGGSPKWIEGDNIDLVTMLKSYYGVSKARPKTWGKAKTTTGGKK